MPSFARGADYLHREGLVVLEKQVDVLTNKQALCSALGIASMGPGRMIYGGEAAHPVDTMRPAVSGEVLWAFGVAGAHHRGRRPSSVGRHCPRCTVALVPETTGLSSLIFSLGCFPVEGLVGLLTVVRRAGWTATNDLPRFEEPALDQPPRARFCCAPQGVWSSLSDPGQDRERFPGV